MKSKFLFLITATALSLQSCVSYRELGELTMAANRNVNMSQNYQLLQTYVGDSKRDIDKSRYMSIDDAIDGIVRQVPGGEYLMNVRIYVLEKSNHKGRYYFAVSGDVWGRPQGDVTAPTPNTQNNNNQQQYQSPQIQNVKQQDYPYIAISPNTAGGANPHLMLPVIYNPKVSDTVTMEEYSPTGQDLQLIGIGIITGVKDATHWIVTYVLSGQNTTGFYEASELKKYVYPSRIVK